MDDGSDCPACLARQKDEVLTQAAGNFLSQQYWQVVFALDPVDQVDRDTRLEPVLLLSMSYAMLGNRPKALESLERIEWEKSEFFHAAVLRAVDRYQHILDNQAYCLDIVTNVQPMQAFLEKGCVGKGCRLRCDSVGSCAKSAMIVTGAILLTFIRFGGEALVH